MSIAFLRSVETAVERLVVARRDGDPNPDDPFRGLYLSDAHIDAHLQRGLGPRQTAPVVDMADDRMADLAAWTGLAPFDCWALAVAAAPDLDARFERFFGYLNDDVSRRRACPGLVMELCGASPGDPWSRSRMQSGSALVDRGLLLVEEVDRPFLSRSLRVPDRVTQYLLGDDRCAAVLDSWAGVARLPNGPTPMPGDLIAYLNDQGNDSWAVLEPSVGHADVVIGDAALLCAEDTDDALRSLIREAALQRALLIVANTDRLSAGAMQLLASSPPVVLGGRRSWNPDWALRLPLRIDAPAALEMLSSWTVTNEQVMPTPASRAGVHSRSTGLVDGTNATSSVSWRLLNGVGLERLATRIQPAASWDDIVVSPPVRRDLQHVVDRVALRGVVLDDWAMRRGGGRGESITALFAGESGTGKTLAAEIVAGALGFDLYVIDLSSVIDKYIGETEKNLERIFTEAEGLNGVLFFDEADAIFGKRSEVRDSKDRYANVEIAYLLQRMERFDGLAILATNLRANLDEAFTRRLSVLIEFPRPDESLRLTLWESMLTGVPHASDLDLKFCARSFELTGGGIRNAAVAAAYFAAAAGQQISMGDIVRGVQYEFRKQGRLLLDEDFGPYALGE